MLGASLSLRHFRGIPTTAVQRLQRVLWLFSFAPHLGQRRAFRLSTNFVRGRVFILQLLSGSASKGPQSKVRAKNRQLATRCQVNRSSQANFAA